MARLPREKESSEAIAKAVLELGVNVQSDEETEGMETDALNQREILLQKWRLRQEEEVALTIAGGRLHGAKNRTNRELHAGAQKVAGQLATVRVKGVEHPTYKRLLAKKTPATYLPSDSAARNTAFEALLAQINAPETPPEIRKAMGGVVKAIAAEKAAAAVVSKAEEKVRKAREKEETQRVKTVAAARALVKAVEGKYSDDTARAREVLDWSESARRTPLQILQDAVKAAKEQLAEAVKAASVADKLRAQIADLETKIAAQKAEDAKKKQKKGRGGTPPAGTGQGGPAPIPE